MTVSADGLCLLCQPQLPVEDEYDLSDVDLDDNIDKDELWALMGEKRGEMEEEEDGISSRLSQLDLVQLFFFNLFGFFLVFLFFFPAPLRDPPPFSRGRMGGELAQLLRNSRKDQREERRGLQPCWASEAQGGGPQCGCFHPASQQFFPVVFRLRLFF